MVWYKNIFNASDNEYLAAVSTYFLDDNTEYTISIYVNNHLVLTQNGVSNRGYYTFNLNEIIPLNKGDSFEVQFNLTVDNVAYVPVGHVYYLNKLLSKEGVSLISNDGDSWYDLYLDNEVACIKAFTYIGIRTNITLAIENDKITAVVTDEYGNILDNGDVTFTINNKTEIISVTGGKAVIDYDFTRYGAYDITASWLEAGYIQAINNTSYETLWDVAVSVKDTDFGNDLTVNITLGEGKSLNDNVTLKIGDKVYNVNVNKNNVLYTVTDKFKAGLWNISLEYVNGDYNKKSINSFTVNKVKSTLDDIVPFDYDYGSSNTVNIDYSGATNVTAFVINHTDASVSVNAKTITITGLNAGDYVLNITTVPDENHTEISKTVSFKVNKYKVNLFDDNGNYNYYYQKDTEYDHIKAEGIVPSGVVSQLKTFNNLIAVIENQSADCVVNHGSYVSFKNLAANKTYVLKITLNETNYEGTKTVFINILRTNTELTVPEIIFDYGSTGSAQAITNTTQLILCVNDTLKNHVGLDGKTVNVYGLAVGNYTFKLKASDENYTSNPVTVRVTVNPIPSTLDDIAPFEYDYDSYGNVAVNYGGATGVNAIIIVDGLVNMSSLSIIGKSIIIRDIPAGEYILSVTTVPDENHTEVSKLTSFKVYDLTFKDLEDLINNSTGEITLNHDYTYHEGDSIIEIPDNVIINGNGHIINAYAKSGIFKVSGKNVVIKNVVLEGGLAADGGAIDWQGDNGILDNAILSNNHAENGGAINWQGDNATISNSKFEKNTANSGAGIIINGNGAKMSNSSFKDNAASDGSDSIAVGENVSENPILDDSTKQNGGNVIKTVNLNVSVKNIVYGDTAIIKVTVSYGLEILTGKIYVNGKSYDLVNNSAEIKFTNLNVGDYSYNITYNGSADYSKPSVISNLTVSKKSISITAKSSSFIINYGGSYTVKLSPAIDGQVVVFTLNGKNYPVIVDNGMATLKLTKSILKSVGSKTITVEFKGSDNYKSSTGKAVITVKKENTKLSKVKAVKKTYKKNAKNKKVKATLKNSKGKALKNKVVYLKVKGKTFKAKTNKNGIVTFKLKSSKVKFAKKGKYKFTVSFKGDGYYKSVNKKGIIKIK